MQSKFRVLLVGSLLCCIPALVYFLFKNMAEEGNVDPFANPQSVMQWPVTSKNTLFSVSLEPEETPLTVGKQHMTLKITPMMEGLSLGSGPLVKVTMPMGKETMEAPAEVHKLPQEMHYRIKTEFSMGGHWMADIKPNPTTDPLHLDFMVKP
jgi:hypothetical protein